MNMFVTHRTLKRSIGSAFESAAKYILTKVEVKLREPLLL